MARIDSKVIFVTTSPRTPAKMIPEIELLNTHFAGQQWNNETQRAFMELLKEENFFNGEGVNDPAFSATDRINRAPKAHGGHLTHGTPVNFSGQLYVPSFYGVEKETGIINYDTVEEIALREKPKLLICGASAYSRDWDYARLRNIADQIGALLLADISHPAGLIATSFLNHPFPHCSKCKNSKGEKLIESILIEKNFKYRTQVKFDELKYINDLRFDFGIYVGDDLKCLIEYNGKQHYEFTEYFHISEKTFIDSQKRDKMKIKFCEENKIKLHIIRYDEIIEQKIKEILNEEI